MSYFFFLAWAYNIYGTRVDAVEESNDNNKQEESSGKTLMELLELEMRARAIKALLKRQEANDEQEKHPSTDDNQITNESSSSSIIIHNSRASQAYQGEFSSSSFMHFFLSLSLLLIMTN